MMQHQVNPYNSVDVYKVKHSGPGIASSIITLVAIFSFIAALASVITAGALEEEFIIANSEDQLGYFLGGLFILLSGVLCIIGFILGIIGLFIHNRNKLFAILGTVFSGVGLLLILVIILFGW